MPRLLPFFALALVGCYRYVEVPVSQLQPGAEVRARVSAVGVDRVRTGPVQQSRLLVGSSVTGKVGRLVGDTVVFGVDRVELEANVRATTTQVDLPLLRSELQSIQLRQLNKRRTVVTSTIVGAVSLAALFITLDRARGGDGPDPPPGSGPESRIPLGVRFSLP